MVDTDYFFDQFSNKMRNSMKKLDLWPRDISRYCGISIETAKNYLQGRSLPGLWVLVLIANLLETTVNNLLDFDEADEDELVCYDPTSIFEDEDEFAEHVSNRVKQAMKDFDVDVFELAKRTGFTRSTIRRWFGLTGARPALPRTSNFLVICDALECAPSDLLGY